MAFAKWDEHGVVLCCLTLLTKEEKVERCSLS